MTMRIDAHQHYWQLRHNDYGWLQPTPALQPIYRDYGPDDLAPLREAAGITGTVLVQAAPSEAETWRLLELARVASHAVLGVVGWCDLTAPDAPWRIAHLAEDTLLKGLRPMLQDLAETDWILQPALAPAIASMLRHGLCFDALVMPRHLTVLGDFIARYPQLPVVVDHGAKPDIAAHTFDSWARGISALARAPHVHCKLSGLATQAGTRWNAETLRPYVNHLLQTFGPARLLWGSDWPVLELAGSYLHWCEATDTLLTGCTPDGRAAILGGNAVRFYGLRTQPCASNAASR